MTEPTLTPADDTLHPPTSDDIFWTETAWFAFAIPERRLTGCIYPLFRPNQNICSAGVYVWDDSGEGAHEILYAQNFWHLPLPEDLRHMELPSGLAYEVLEPLHRYRVSYRDGNELALNLVYEGLIPPHPTERGGVVSHLDHPCRVTGTLRLGDEELAVDCLEMRDKSWGIRPDFRWIMGTTRAAYTYGLASADSAFLALSASPDGGEGTVMSGVLVRDGELAPLVSGIRRADLERGRPTKVVVEATDARGRSFRAEGRCVNRFAFQSSPGLFAWMSGTEWDLDGQPAWGEDQLMVPPSIRVADLRQPT
jgi:hypothetical protein